MSKQPEQTPEERALRELLQPLTDVPPRDSRQAARGRAQFLSQVSSLESPVSSGPISRLNDWLRTREQNQLRFRTLTIALFLAAFFLGGVSASAYASRQALPGAPLYGIKLFFEEAQLTLTSDPTRNLELHLQFANNRVDELQTILSQPGAQEPTNLAANFDRHVNTVDILLARVTNSDDYQDQLTQILAAYDSLHLDSEDPDVQTTQEPSEIDLTPEPQEETQELEAEIPDGESDDEEDEPTPATSAPQESQEETSSGEETDGSGEEDHPQEDDESDHSEEDDEEDETPQPDPTHESDEENDS